MRDKLRNLPRVESVTSLLDVPLVMSPPANLRDLAAGIRRLEEPGTDRHLAREELQTSPLYRDLVLSGDGSTTAMTIAFEANHAVNRAYCDPWRTSRPVNILFGFACESAALCAWRCPTSSSSG